MMLRSRRLALVGRGFPCSLRKPPVARWGTPASRRACALARRPAARAWRGGPRV